MKKKFARSVIHSVSTERTEINDEQLLVDIVKRRARRLGISEADVLGQSEAELSSLNEIIRLSKQTGKPPLDVLEDELNSEDPDDYPGPDCLLPYEFEQSHNGSLPNDRVAHLGACEVCNALSLGMNPTNDQIEEFKSALLRQWTPTVATAGKFF